MAEVHRDGKIYRQEFARGEPTTDMQTVGVAKSSGTTITFLPDGDIYEEIESEDLRKSVEKAARASLARAFDRRAV